MDNIFIVSLLSMAGLAVFFAGVLAIADKKLKVQEDPKVEKVLDLLPGVNCGACGCLSCHDFAEKIVNEGADPSGCKVVPEEARNQICEFMGHEGGEVIPFVALVHCAADNPRKKRKGDYRGIKTCAAATLAFNAGMECGYGCIGYGDCVKVCPFDAIHMVDGLPRVDAAKCTGCGKCVEACPLNIISLAEKKYKKLFYVACSSHDDLMRTRQVCDVGCIACGVCTKLAQEPFFMVEDNLSRADHKKQGDAGIIENIQAKCPTRVIKDI